MPKAWYAAPSAYTALPCASPLWENGAFGHFLLVRLLRSITATDLGIITVITHQPVYLLPGHSLVWGTRCYATSMELRVWQVGCHSHPEFTSPYFLHTF